jgi:catalase
VLYDALIVADGAGSAKLLMNDADALEFVRQQYRHCKPILAVGAGADLLARAGVSAELVDGADDASLWLAEAGAVGPALEKFKQALAGHRNFQRETAAAAL